MSTKLTLLEVLSQHTNLYLSGQQLADQMGISRNAVWKAIRKLQEQGYNICTRPGVGYRLMEQSDIITSDSIAALLHQPCKIYIHPVLDSTMYAARALKPCKEPCIIIANEQTAGRGRLGRNFFSPPGAGLYMTVAFHPEFGLDKSMLVTTIAAVAVCRAIDQVTGLSPKIKWVNDLYLNEKKICGIMTEAQSSFETGNIDRIIIGIGVNCFKTAVPEELADTLTYIENPKRAFTRSELAAAIVNHLFAALAEQNTHRLLREYKSRSFILGEQIMIYDTIRSQSPTKETKGIKARAIDIDENGGLVVEYMEGRKMREMETITTGEVSIRKW